MTVITTTRQNMVVLNIVANSSACVYSEMLVMNAGHPTRILIGHVNTAPKTMKQFSRQTHGRCKAQSIILNGRRCCCVVHGLRTCNLCSISIGPRAQALSSQEKSWPTLRKILSWRRAMTQTTTHFGGEWTKSAGCFRGGSARMHESHGEFRVSFRSRERIQRTR